MVINQKFFNNGFKSLFHGAQTWTPLVALGSFASFGYSSYALFAMTYAEHQGDAEAVMGYMHEFYFESAAMILTHKSSRKNVRGPFQRKDYRCLYEPA